MADVLAAAKPSDWRTLDPDNTLYLELASGRVVIELAPEFAPQHVANIRTKLGVSSRAAAAAWATEHGLI